ncbi:bacteriohemerythrin [Desulfomonile tiedjei]|uniref:Hemerythrin-like metal-binding domain-containing protein n=1 Tax=Desulfomonile tiedjei (strain ATCC 49306 / DSM 6799 / DCB-1) TaxID=706587 RepID=I4C9G7_DESTA|nr:bacteriohemerythrin [Desulfomonile tiedjei]AFM26208.1 hemerythrin-like metal-binding domain-containing protein [Desulfomonile tiedjei DSM 6799]
MADWISWTSDLTLNVPKIDEQHRELIRQFNDLGEAVWDGKGREAIGDILRFLADYTVKHFRDREPLMDTLSYPNSDAHMKVHAALIEEVSEFIRKVEVGSVESQLVISVVDRLGQWTRQHIRLEDKALGQYVLSKE